MTAITHDETSGVFLLDGVRTSYALAASTDGRELRHVHWGARVDIESAAAMARASDAPRAIERITWAGEDPLEYTPWGAQRYDEPSLKVEFADGTRGIEWHLTGHRVEPSTTGDGSSTLVLELSDLAYPLRVELCYRVFDDSDVLERWARVANVGDSPIILRQALSANLWMPIERSWRLRYLQGGWGSENQITEVPLRPGRFVLESRRGTTSHEAAPWFALDPLAQSTEEHGAIYSGALAWSGSWKIVVETTPGGRVHACGGINDFDAPILLAPGSDVVLPVMACLYSDAGYGGSSRAWHAYQLSHVLSRSGRDGGSPSFPAADGPARPAEARAVSLAAPAAATGPAGTASTGTGDAAGTGGTVTPRSVPPCRPVLYNSWEATWFSVDEPGQARLAELAAEMGVELFVVDDGWFTGRRDDHAALGDWVVDREKFPDGLAPLVTRVKQLKMGFGLWVEPEMTNPDSDLYRAHPDWVLHFAGRTRTERRNQLVLNLARDDVAAWVLATLDRLLGELDIDFVKWDMNRHLAEPGWPSESGRNPERVWLDYTRNLYAILDMLRAAHPRVDIESCSGGGGRVDLGILSRTEQVWTSDNTDALDRIAIQEGFSQAWCAQSMMAWVTDSPNPLTRRRLPLSFRFHVAMAGSLGIGGNLIEWSEEERAEARDLVALYKQIRPTVQHGSLYRLASTREGPNAAVEYVSRDGDDVVVLAFSVPRPLRPWPSRLRLAGLDDAAVYRDLDTGAEQRGAVLRHRGVELPAGQDVASRVVRLRRL
jgi:alpha-galactosidase